MCRKRTRACRRYYNRHSGKLIWVVIGAFSAWIMLIALIEGGDDGGFQNSEDTPWGMVELMLKDAGRGACVCVCVHCVLTGGAQRPLPRQATDSNAFTMALLLLLLDILVISRNHNLT